MSKYKVEMNGYSFQDYPKLSHQKTMELINQYHQGYLYAKEVLILSNLKLVLSLASKYQQRVDNLDDLFQVGIIGLIKAIDNFNTSLNLQFSTYAVPLILGEMKRHIRECSSVRIPRSLRDIAYKALKANEEYMKTYHKEATSSQLSQILGVDEYDIIEALASTQGVASLSQEVQNDGQSKIDLESQIPDRHNHIEDIHSSIDLQKAMQHLTKKELQIIQERYYLGHTQSEIAKELMISQAQVSRLEKQALSHLKKHMC